MSFRSKLGRVALPAILLASLALPASAHPGHDTGGFAEGFAHPFGGFDHLLAMLAVGLWAVQFATRSGNRMSLWMLPAAFVLPMGAGFLLALNGQEYIHLALPGVEAGIALSVLILGLAVAFAARPPLLAAMAVTAGFALFHGFAHGSEMGEGTATAYAGGMLLATALLHGAGLVTALLSQQVATPVLTRAAGAIVAVAGVVILVA